MQHAAAGACEHISSFPAPDVAQFASPPGSSRARESTCPALALVAPSAGMAHRGPPSTSSIMFPSDGSRASSTLITAGHRSGGDASSTPPASAFVDRPRVTSRPLLSSHHAHAAREEAIQGVPAAPARAPRVQVHRARGSSGNVHDVPVSITASRRDLMDLSPPTKVTHLPLAPLPIGGDRQARTSSVSTSTLPVAPHLSANDIAFAAGRAAAGADASISSSDGEVTPQPTIAAHTGPRRGKRSLRSHASSASDGVASLTVAGTTPEHPSLAHAASAGALSARSTDGMASPVVLRFTPSGASYMAPGMVEASAASTIISSPHVRAPSRGAPPAEAYSAHGSVDIVHDSPRGWLSSQRPGYAVLAQYGTLASSPNVTHDTPTATTSTNRQLRLQGTHSASVDVDGEARMAVGRMPSVAAHVVHPAQTQAARTQLGAYADDAYSGDDEDEPRLVPLRVARSSSDRLSALNMWPAAPSPRSDRHSNAGLRGTERTPPLLQRPPSRPTFTPQPRARGQSSPGPLDAQAAAASPSQLSFTASSPTAATPRGSVSGTHATTVLPSLPYVTSATLSPSRVASATHKPLPISPGLSYAQDSTVPVMRSGTAFFVSAATERPMIPPASTMSRSMDAEQLHFSLSASQERSEEGSAAPSSQGLGFGASMGLFIGVTGYGRAATTSSDDAGTVDGGTASRTELVSTDNTPAGSPRNGRNVVIVDTTSASEANGGMSGSEADARMSDASTPIVRLPSAPPAIIGSIVSNARNMPPGVAVTPGVETATGTVRRLVPGLQLEPAAMQRADDSINAFHEDQAGESLAGGSGDFGSWKESFPGRGAAVVPALSTAGMGRPHVGESVDLTSPSATSTRSRATGVQTSSVLASPADGITPQAVRSSARDDGHGGGGSAKRKSKKASIKLTATGSLEIEGFTIRESGIEGTPDRPRVRTSGTSVAARSDEGGASRASASAGARTTRVSQTDRRHSDADATILDVHAVVTPLSEASPAAGRGAAPPVAGGAAATSASPISFKDASVRVEVLGQGASGTVYKMVHVPTLTMVAAKMIHMYDAERRHSMAKELKALYSNLTAFGSAPSGATEGGAALTSAPAAGGVRALAPCPYIVAFYDAFVDAAAGTLTFVMEYLDGGSLQDIVDTGGCPDESVLANISWRVLKGLEFIHNRRLIHRDIKPSNLLINHAGGVKIADFGIIREMNDTMEAHTFVGTVTYMSPERIAGESYGYTSDIWSAGLSILTCAEGQFPIDTEGGYWALLHRLQNDPSPVPTPGKFSREFEDFIAHALRKDPHERPDATALLQHPFVRSCGAAVEASRGAPLLPEETVNIHSVNRGTIEDLKDLCRKVQEYRFRSALKRREKRLPLIPPERFESLARQMGLPGEVVARCFNKYQRAYDDKLREIADVARSYHAPASEHGAAVVAAAAEAMNGGTGAARMDVSPAGRVITLAMAPGRRLMHAPSRHASNPLETIEEADSLQAAGAASARMPLPTEASW